MAQVQVIDVDAQQQAPPAYTAEQLDQLVGSIALYPDPLIAQLLPASTYPLDVVRAARWSDPAQPRPDRRAELDPAFGDRPLPTVLT